jgi:hypothetical protein
MTLNTSSTLEEVAATVSGALINAGITATLSGGGAVSIYSHNEYQSKDLDFVTASMLADTRPVMETLGFEYTGTGHLSEFKHPELEWFVEFVPAPITFGDHIVTAEDCATIELEQGMLRIVTPTQSVMDRLAAAFHWQDPQSRDQALQIARHQNIDWSELKVWFAGEGQSADEFEKFRQAAGRL